MGRRHRVHCESAVARSRMQYLCAHTCVQGPAALPRGSTRPSQTSAGSARASALALAAWISSELRNWPALDPTVRRPLLSAVTLPFVTPVPPPVTVRNGSRELDRPPRGHRLRPPRTRGGVRLAASPLQPR